MLQKQNPRLGLLFGSALLTLLLGGCGDDEEKTTAKQDQEIKLAVKEDSKLKSSTEDLLRKRGALVRLRKKLSKKRSELENKKKNLAAGDKAAVEALEKEEAQLLKKERELFRQEGTVNRKLLNLLEKRSTLLSKANQALSTAASSAGAPKAARREAAVANREKQLAQREKELAKREAALAKREAEMARREKELAKGCAAMTPSFSISTVEVPRGSGGARKYSKSDVKSVYDKALHVMSRRGIRTSDLPSAVRKLKSDIRSYLRKKEYYRGKYASDQFLKIVRSIKIDRAFVSAKMARLNRRIQRKKLSSSKENKVNELFRQATQAYGDAKFRRANAKLNRIYSVMR